MTGRVDGKVALVTGAARGQGRTHAVRLASEGADVIAVDVCGPLPHVRYPPATPADLDETARLVQACDRRVVPLVTDVRDIARLRVGVDAAVGALGRLDIVVANAGICVPAPWDEVDPDLFETTMSINVTGTWNTVVVAAPHLVSAGGGSVVLISSAAGLKVAPYMAPYTASKFAVRGMAKALAAELAVHRVRVNSVHPCAVDTPMSGGATTAAVQRGTARDPRLAAMFSSLLPTDKLSPEDVTAVVLFLASDESHHITASEMAVDLGVSQY